MSYWCRLLIVTLIGLGSLLVAGCSDDPAPANSAELETYTQRYLTLVNAGDVSTLTRHLGRDDETDARQRIARYGDRQLRDLKLSYRSEFPNVYLMDIRATSAVSGETIDMRETVVWNGHRRRWTMAPLAGSTPSATRG